MSNNKKEHQHPKNDHKKGKILKKSMAIFLSVLVVLLILAICWYFFIFKDSSAPEEAKYNPGEIKSLIVSGDIDQARVMAEAALNKNDSLEVRRQLANVEEAAGNHEKVIEIYKTYLNSSSNGLNSDDYGRIAMAYEKADDKKSAAIYYRKSADVMGKEYLSADKEYLYNYADILEGKTGDGI